MKRIIIITDALTKPLYNIRMQFLCNTLVKKGITVTWITEKHTEIPFEINCNFIQIPFYRHKGLVGKLEWITKNILSLLFDYKNRYFTKKVIAQTRNDNYDMVLCSTFHTFGLKSAYSLAKKKNIPLHIDLRDIAEQYETNIYSNNVAQINILDRIYRETNINRRNKIIQKADSLSSVSQWHVNFLKQFNPNTILIYNGFDNKEFYFKPIVTDKFDIVYTGRWYGEKMQDPTLVFSALDNIISKGIIPPDDLRFIWYTETKMHGKIHDYAKRFNLQKNVFVYGYVSRELIPDIIRNSSICLVLSNDNSKGIMTTKLYEALGCEKPVLCTNCSRGDLHDLIINTESGIATASIQEIIGFITTQYNIWKRQHFTHAQSKNIDFYSRQYQTSLLTNHLESLCSK